MAKLVTVVGLMVTGGLILAACSSGTTASTVMPTTSCQGYRNALAAALAVPGPGQTLDPSAMALLSRSERDTITKSRSTFLASANRTAQQDHATAESQYQAQLNQGPYTAGPPTPPPPVSTFEASAITTLTPSWQKWTAQMEGDVMKEHHCG